MSKKTALLAKSIVTSLLLTVSGYVHAAIVNPDPSVLADDVGVETFSPQELTATIEIYDPLAPFTSFGFYFVGSDVFNSANRITIFDPLDQGEPAIPGAPVQAALIDFSAGIVADYDDGVFQEIQSTFTAGLGDVGFYLDVAGAVVFSESAHNGPFGDLSATFTVLGEPLAHVIGFESAEGDVLSFNLVGGFTASTAVVPVPGALLLMLSALPLFGFVARRSAVKAEIAGQV